MGLKGIFECLIVRVLSPIFFTADRVLTVTEFCLTTAKENSVHLNFRREVNHKLLISNFTLNGTIIYEMNIMLLKKT